jgi:hypothetical protein
MNKCTGWKRSKGVTHHIQRIRSTHNHKARKMVIMNDTERESTPPPPPTHCVAAHHGHTARDSRVLGLVPETAKWV